MWTLFVISVTMGIPEVKVTRYNEYESQWSCNIALGEIDNEFNEGEKAICLKTGKNIPGIDRLY